MAKDSYTGPSHVQQVLFNLAAFVVVVAGMRASSDILIPFLLAIAAVAQVAGSISMLLNKYVVVCALGFAAMTILININLHDFWNVYEGVDVKHEYQNFFKNLGIFAGLLLLAAVNLDKAEK